ncbi:MAG: rubrerythrin family protein, partial [Odoribacter splanchnicus]
MSEEEIRQLTDFQINEITEHRIYSRLAALQKNSHNRQVLSELAKEELTHFYTLKKYTGKTPAPQLWKVNRYVW